MSCCEFDVPAPGFGRNAPWVNFLLNLAAQIPNGRRGIEGLPAIKATFLAPRQIGTA